MEQRERRGGWLLGRASEPAFVFVKSFVSRPGALPRCHCTARASTRSPKSPFGGRGCARPLRGVTSLTTCKTSKCARDSAAGVPQRSLVVVSLLGAAAAEGTFHLSELTVLTCQLTAD